jgi:chromosome segregation ATPase
MTLFDDLGLKLEGAKSDLEKLMAEFHDVVELRNSLQASDIGLRAASDNLAKLAGSLDVSTTKLTECVSALRAAATNIDTSDLNEMRRAKDALGQRISLLARAVEKLEKRMAGTSTREWVLLLLVAATLSVSGFSFYLEHGLSIIGTSLAN